MAPSACTTGCASPAAIRSDPGPGSASTRDLLRPAPPHETVTVGRHWIIHDRHVRTGEGGARRVHRRPLRAVPHHRARLRPDAAHPRALSLLAGDLEAPLLLAE